jgi:hypothetical protein
MSRTAIGVALVALAALAAGADRPADVEFAGPAGSGEPNLTVGLGGAVILTWLEPHAPAGHRLRVAVRRDGSWSRPVTVLASDSLFVNWADFPSLLALRDGTWIVHWLARVPGGRYAYHVRVARSADQGRTWTLPLTPHRDSSPREHGFVAMAAADDSTTAMIWLDGRAMTAPEQGDMTLRFTRVTASGRLMTEELLDERTCECCQTALVRTQRGLLAAYRDRSPQGIRDISIVRQIGATWTAPTPVARDGWAYPGCPVNGPALAARGDRVALTWFTAPAGRARVFTAFSTDGGATWTAPTGVDHGRPLGRVDVDLQPDGTAVVAWLEVGDDGAEVRARSVRPDGPAGRSWRVAGTTEARSSGFPRIAITGEDIFIAWTSEEGVRVASFPIRR